MARSRTKLVVGSTLAMAFVSVLTAACVDLFHSTDFATLCTTNPTDPQCFVDGSASETGPLDDGGVDSSRPHPDFCSWSRTEVYRQATLACARIGAYVGPLSNLAQNTDSLTSTSFGQCVVSAQLAFDCKANPSLRPTLGGAVDSFWSCVSTATTKEQVFDCFYPGGPNVCKGGATYFACASAPNNTEIHCGSTPEGDPLGAEACAMYGQTCSQKDPGAGCTGRQGRNCVTSGCTGTQASDCVGPIDRGIDCATVSATCVMTGVAPACRPTVGSSCSPDTAAACGTGDKASACIGGRLAEIDCSALGAPSGSTAGLPCDVTTKPVPLYALANACADYTDGGCTETEAASNNCTSTVLTSCARGRTVTIDCVQAGFSTCVDGDGTTPAHCATPTK